MTRQAIIEKTIRVFNQLPEDKAAEISTLAEFVMKQYEEQQLTQGIGQMAACGAQHSISSTTKKTSTRNQTYLKERYNG